MNHPMASKARGQIAAFCCLITLALASSATAQNLGSVRTIERYNEVVQQFREHGHRYFAVVVKANSSLLATIPTNMTYLPEDLDELFVALGNFQQILPMDEAHRTNRRQAIFRLSIANEKGRLRTYGVIKLILRPNGVLRIQITMRNPPTEDRPYFHHPDDDPDLQVLSESLPAYADFALTDSIGGTDYFMGVLDVQRRSRTRQVVRQGMEYPVLRYVAQSRGIIVPLEEVLRDSE